jgi:hypothetical protein
MVVECLGCNKVLVAFGASTGIGTSCFVVVGGSGGGTSWGDTVSLVPAVLSVFENIAMGMTVILVVGQTAYAAWGNGTGSLGLDLSAEVGNGFVFGGELID